MHPNIKSGGIKGHFNFFLTFKSQLKSLIEPKIINIIIQLVLTDSWV